MKKVKKTQYLSLPNLAVAWNCQHVLKKGCAHFCPCLLFKSKVGAKAEALEHLHPKRENNSFILE
jgi:hypothetical protein